MTHPRHLIAAAAMVAALSACASPSGTANSAPSTDADGSLGQVVAPSSSGKVRAPDAEGTVASVEQTDAGTVVVFSPFDSFSYFADAVVTFPPGEVLVDAEGSRIDASQLVSGQQVRLWVSSCVESYPVRCVGERVEAYVAP